MTPIWLMDVDGVLNAIGVKEPYAPGLWTEWERTTSNGFGIIWSPQLIDRVQALVDAGKVEVQWLTTWWDTIEQLPFTAWHGFTVANTREEYLETAVDWWKLPVAQRIAADGRKVVWTDDDLIDTRAKQWAASQPNVLAIAPNPYRGLTPKDLDRIEAFLSA